MVAGNSSPQSQVLLMSPKLTQVFASDKRCTRFFSGLGLLTRCVISSPLINVVNAAYWSHNRSVGLHRTMPATTRQ